jgi:cysteine desulfuration protein SufE
VNAGEQRSASVVQDEIIAEMSSLEDWLAKYEYLVARGRELCTSEDGIRTEENALAGCQSSVWIKAELHDGRVRLAADSDAMITRGIIALLLRVLDGRAPGEVARTELYFLDRTGLRTHLSPARANGLAAMVRKIRTYAEEWT